MLFEQIRLGARLGDFDSSTAPCDLDELIPPFLESS